MSSTPVLAAGVYCLPERIGAEAALSARLGEEVLPGTAGGPWVDIGPGNRSLPAAGRFGNRAAAGLAFSPAGIAWRLDVLLG